MKTKGDTCELLRYCFPSMEYYPKKSMEEALNNKTYAFQDKIDNSDKVRNITKLAVDIQKYMRPCTIQTESGEIQGDRRAVPQFSTFRMKNRTEIVDKIDARAVDCPMIQLLGFVPTISDALSPVQLDNGISVR